MNVINNINPWRGLAGLPPLAWWVALATFLNRAGSMVLPFLVLYLTRSLGWEPSEAGWVLVLYGCCSMLAGPISGRLCDRFGSARILVGSLMGASLVLLVFPAAQSGPAIACATLALGLFTASFRPASLAIQAEILPEHLRRQGYALNRLAVNAGMSVGPAVGGFLAGWWFPAIFYVDGGTALLASLVLARILRSRERARPTAVASRSGGLAPLTDPTFRRFLGGCFLLGLGFFQLDSTMPLTVVEGLGMSERDFGLVFTVNTIIVVLFEVAINDWTRKWGSRRALMVGGVLVGAGLGSMALVHEFNQLIATVLVWTVGEMIFAPAQALRVTELAPEGQTGAYMGLMTSCYGLAFAVGPALGIALLGLLGQAAFWPLIFIACTAGGLLMASEPRT